jgi:drug/metabolite transporter (DMT)-like permease
MAPLQLKLNGSIAIPLQFQSVAATLKLPMYFLIFAVMCSVAVSVLLRRGATRWRIDATQAVTWNYAMAAILCALLLRPPLQTLRELNAPWLELLLLSVCLPSIFLVFAKALNLAGIARTDAAQRLALLLTLGAAFALFGEEINVLKIAGLAVGALAIAGILARPADNDLSWKQAGPWLLGVCCGYAFIDYLLKRISLHGVTSMVALQVSFILAFIFMMSWLLWQVKRGRIRLTKQNFFAGMLLGALNFANIFFYVRAHQVLSDSPATVFATMNIGVVALGTLVGVFAFKEKISIWNKIGLIFAVTSIALIALEKQM